MVQVRSAALPQHARRQRTTLVLVLAALGAVILGAAILAYRVLWPPAPAPQPVVSIRSPRDGQQVAVGQPVMFSSFARGKDRIVRVELWADGQLQDAQTSSLPDGSSLLPLLANWQPTTPGKHTLTARAFDNQGGRAHASVSLQAIQPPDRDGDGVLDADDACPDQPGWTLTQGCPDTDGDGIVDADDACPDEAGPAATDGCPQPTEGDRDGDGVADDADASPDEAGSPALQGRPLPTEPEPSPAEPPAPPPDADGDGVSDDRDLCPDATGPADGGGCPPSEAGDRDGDGLADDVDLAPEEPGLPEHGGCPPPDADGDGDGVPDEEEAPELTLGLFRLLWPMQRLFVPAPKALITAEFQALELGTHQPYDHVVCYACLGDGPAERIGPLDSPDGLSWNIADYLGVGANRLLLVPDDQPFPLRVECSAYRTASQEVPGDTPDGSFGDAGAEEVYFDLGTLTASDPPEVWDGRALTAVSVRDSDPPGMVFHMRYRICRGSCAGSSLPPPVLGLYHDGADHLLTWSWDGDPDAIDGFLVRCDCDRAGFFTRWAPKDWRILPVSDLEPSCGDTCSFTVTARRNSDGVESPLSNAAVWEGQPCPGTLCITFRTVTSYGHGHAICDRGPIYGAFWANDEFLWFDGADAGYFNGEEGYCIPAPTYGDCGFNVQSMFDSIRELARDQPTFSYEAPLASRLYIPMRYDEDLTVGFRISDYNHEGGATILADRSDTIPAAHLLSDDFCHTYDWGRIEYDAGAGWYTLSDSNCYLYFRLEWYARPQVP